jgi:hypothetical protein
LQAPRSFEKLILCPDRLYEATNAQNAQSPLHDFGANALNRMDARRSGGEGAFSPAFHRASLGRFQGRLRAPIVRSAAPCRSCIGPSARGCGTCWFRSAAVFCDPLRFVVRVHQHGACILENNHQLWLAREEASRGRFTCSWALTACRSISRSRPVRRMTIGCVRFSNPILQSRGQLAGVSQTRIQSEFGCARISPRHNCLLRESFVRETHDWAIHQISGRFNWTSDGTYQQASFALCCYVVTVSDKFSLILFDSLFGPLGQLNIPHR